MQVGGVPIRYIESMTFRIENNMEAIAALDGRTKPDKIKRNDFRRIFVNGTVQFHNDGEYDRFVGGSETTFRGPRAFRSSRNRWASTARGGGNGPQKHMGRSASFRRSLLGPSLP